MWSSSSDCMVYVLEMHSTLSIHKYLHNPYTAGHAQLVIAISRYLGKQSNVFCPSFTRYQLSQS